MKLRYKLILLVILDIIVLMQSLTFGNYLSDTKVDVLSVVLLVIVNIMAIALYKNLEPSENIGNMLVLTGVVLAIFNFASRIIAYGSDLENPIMKAGLLVLILGIPLSWRLEVVRKTRKKAPKPLYNKNKGS